MNIPNILTSIRFGMIPILVVVFFGGGEYRYLWSLVVFTLASATDVLDGYIARKNNLITTFGKVADPLADKLMQIAVLLCMSIDGIIDPWVICIVGAKELMMIVGGAILYKNKIEVSADKYGKLATVAFYIMIVSIIVFENMNMFIKYGIIFTFLCLTVLAFCNYAAYFRKVQSER